MSWPLKYDPASQSISFGGRDKTLYPNTLAPFDQAALAAGDVSRTYCDRDRERRPRSENKHSEVGNEKVEDTSAEGTNPESRCAIATTLNIRTSISFTNHDESGESMQKQKRFVKSLARGKWNRYRRQYTSNTSYEAHNPAITLSTPNDASTPFDSAANMPYLTLSEAQCATLNSQGVRALVSVDQNIEGCEWSSDSFLVSPAPAAVILTVGNGLLTVNNGLGMSEAISTLPKRFSSTQMSVGEKRAPAEANTPAPQERLGYKHQNKDLSCALKKPSFFHRLLHPTENIIKPAIQFATKIFFPKHDKPQQSEKQAWDLDIEKNGSSKRDVKQWRAKEAHRPLFTQKWVQIVANVVDKGREKEKEGGCGKDGRGWR